MALPDISKLTVSELEELIKVCASQIETRRKAAKRDLAKQFKDMAKSEGLAIEEILGDAAPGAGARKRRAKKAGRKKAGRKKTRGKVAPKYRNPKNASETWTGRGRKPLWVQAALDSGKQLKDLAIK